MLSYNEEVEERPRTVHFAVVDGVEVETQGTRKGKRFEIHDICFELVEDV